MKLRTLVKGCQKALEDLDAMVDKYVKLSSGASGLRGKAQKISKKLDWNIKDVDSLRLRLISNTNMLEAFNSGITRYDSNFSMDCHGFTPSFPKASILLLQLFTLDMKVTKYNGSQSTS